MKIWRELLIVLLLFGAVWFVFTWSPVDLPDSDIALSREREQDLAELILDDLKQTNTFYDDSVSLALLYPLADRLLTALDSPTYEYTFHVIESGQINAFATINGHIFVYSGLIEFVSGPEELAAILAHEIGHHENGDLVDRLLKELGLTVIATVLTGGDAVIVSEITRLLISKGFDRRQEREADDFAYATLIDAEISPARLAHFFTRLKAEEETYPDELEVIMTHPNSKSRIERALSTELPEDFEERDFSLNWDELLSSYL